jgi:quercetin dioxygenase-like cupin family protein
MLKGLPGDSCPCPHWGYVTSGTLTFRFADREEVCQAGDAFYVGPGHTPSATAGTEYLQFSPAAELQAVTAAIVRNMQAAQSA